MRVNQADVAGKNESGCTPLHYAASKGHHKVTELLLTAGADVGAVDSRESTALHKAAALVEEPLAVRVEESGAGEAAGSAAARLRVEESGHAAQRSERSERPRTAGLGGIF